MQGPSLEMARPRPAIPLLRFVPAAASWLKREPLLQFMLLGAAIFGIDALLHPAAQDARTIIVTKAMQESFIRGFDEDGIRKPSGEQLSNMIESWVGSEILYREGKALGVDRGDEMIRDRIAFKVQLLMFDQVRLDKPSEAQLREFFARIRGRFDQPERVSFLLTPATDEPEARRQLEEIRAEREASELRDSTRVFPERPVGSLDASFGDGFRARLLAQAQGVWSLIESREGWHIARLDAHEPAVPARFEAVREDVARQWTTEETRRRAWAAVQKLRAGYQVRVET